MLYTIIISAAAGPRMTSMSAPDTMADMAVMASHQVTLNFTSPSDGSSVLTASATSHEAVQSHTIGAWSILSPIRPAILILSLTEYEYSIPMPRGAMRGSIITSSLFTPKSARRMFICLARFTSRLENPTTQCFPAMAIEEIFLYSSSSALLSRSLVSLTFSLIMVRAGTSYSSMPHPLIMMGSPVASDILFTMSVAFSGVVSPFSGSSPANLTHIMSAPISFHILAHSTGSFWRPSNMSAASWGYSARVSNTSPAIMGLVLTGFSKDMKGMPFAPPAM